mgnify:CR=1 FL=1
MSITAIIPVREGSRRLKNQKYCTLCRNKSFN